MSDIERASSTVPLSWDEVYYTNCPLVSASNVDQELGWTHEVTTHPAGDGSANRSAVS